MLLVPPTALTRTRNEYIPEDEITVGEARRIMDEHYTRRGCCPCVEDGHRVVEYEGIVEMAIILNIPEIWCREYHFDSRPADQLETNSG
jgi:hypothetical protein